MRPVTRFAPSPTGRLHLGHAWSAIQSHDRARGGREDERGGGRFLLRIEDIDRARSRDAFVEAIVEDLAWLGLSWDGEIVFQSRRLHPYQAALDRLGAMELLYPCFCTRAEIAASLAAPHGDAAAYPGTCRHLAGAERARRMAGEQHAWRLDMAAAVRAAAVGCDRGLVWEDELAGTQVADPLPQGDVILARKDAPASYHLAVTLDDAAQGVSHVVRGRDLFAATHVHRLLQALLKLPTPIYRHHALLTDAAGNRLAKRDGAPTLEQLRRSGIDGRELANSLRDGRLPIGFAAASP